MARREKPRDKAANVASNDAPEQGSWASRSVLLTILANLIPLAGVLWWDWDLVNVFALYWLETVIIAVFSLLKMGCARPGKQNRFVSIAAFLVVYAVLSAFYGMAIIGLLAKPRTFPDVVDDLLSQWPFYLVALIALVLEHGQKFVVFIRSGEYRRIDVDSLPATAFMRIIVLHLVLALGGFLGTAKIPGIGSLVLLIAVKTCCDLPDTAIGGRIKTAMGVGAAAGAAAFIAAMFLLMLPAGFIAAAFPAAVNLVAYAMIAAILLAVAAAVGGAAYILIESSPRSDGKNTLRTAALLGAVAAIATFFALDMHRWEARMVQDADAETAAE